MQKQGTGTWFRNAVPCFLFVDRFPCPRRDGLPSMKRGAADSISDFVAASKPKVDENTGEKITTEKYAAKIEVDTEPSIIH
jgi:hypothetical protein